MSVEQNKAIVLKFYAAFDQKDVEQGRLLDYASNNCGINRNVVPTPAASG